MRIIIIGMLAVILCVSVFSYSSAQLSSIIPESIKQEILFWIEGKSSDKEFTNIVQKMIENNLINIPQIEKLQQKNQQLEEKISQLEEKILQIESYQTSQKLTITVHTNKAQYSPGDSIMIFGFVNYLIPEHDVGIVISDSTGKILAIAQIPPNADGTYGFVASDPVFKEFGEYDVHVYYGGKAFSNTSYIYSPVRYS